MRHLPWNIFDATAIAGNEGGGARVRRMVMIRVRGTPPIPAAGAEGDRIACCVVLVTWTPQFGVVWYQWLYLLKLSFLFAYLVIVIGSVGIITNEWLVRPVR